MHGWKLKISKILNFWRSILKLAVWPLNIHNFNFNCQLSLDRLNINRKTYYNLLYQHLEADFLWKVSLKILNSGIILKTFTHEDLIFCLSGSMKSQHGITICLPKIHLILINKGGSNTCWWASIFGTWAESQWSPPQMNLWLHNEQLLTF